MEVYPCSTTVTSKLGNIKGMITSAAIRFDRVAYEITYYSDGDFKTVWMNEGEFTTEEGKVRIGFKNS